MRTLYQKLGYCINFTVSMSSAPFAPLLRQPYVIVLKPRHDSRLTSNRTIDGEPSRQTHVFIAHQKLLVIAFLVSLFLIRPPSARAEIISYLTSSPHQLGSIDFPHTSHRYTFSTNFVSSARRRAASASASCNSAYSSNALDPPTCPP